MQNHNSAQVEIEHLLFELQRCVNDLSHHRLKINPHDIQQAELSLYKLESLITMKDSAAYKSMSTREYSTLLSIYGTVNKVDYRTACLISIISSIRCLASDTGLRTKDLLV